MHTAGVVAEMPGAGDIPRAGTVRGLKQLRDHFAAFDALFRSETIHPREYHAAGDHTFQSHDRRLATCKTG